MKIGPIERGRHLPRPVVYGHIRPYLLDQPKVVQDKRRIVPLREEHRVPVQLLQYVHPVLIRDSIPAKIVPGSVRNQQEDRGQNRDRNAHREPSHREPDQEIEPEPEPQGGKEERGNVEHLDLGEIHVVRDPVHDIEEERDAEHEQHPAVPPSRIRRRRERETRLIAGGRRPVYYVFRAGVSLPPGYMLAPEGLCYRALRAPGTPNGTFWERRDPDRLAAFPVHKDGWVRKLVANYYFARAEFRVAVGDSARGFEDYDKAGEIAFDAWVVHYNLASVYRAAGHLDRTREALTRAVSLNPLMPEIYYRLGLVCSEQGEYEAAQTWWRRALRVDPGYRAARERLRAFHSMGER